MGDVTYTTERRSHLGCEHPTLLFTTSFGVKLLLAVSDGSMVKNHVTLATYSACCGAQPFLSRKVQERRLRWRCQECSGLVEGAISALEWLSAQKTPGEQGSLLGETLTALAGRSLDPILAAVAGQALADVVMEFIQGVHPWESKPATTLLG